MARYAYVNGSYVDHRDAAVHVEDRGYQLADGIYEVVLIQNGRFVDKAPHLDRWERSLSELEIPAPVPRRVLEMLMVELVRRNNVRNGTIYLQATRGVAPRNHAYPERVTPSLVMTTKHVDFAAQTKFKTGVHAITMPDLRWARCDIKTTGLLPNCMAKTAAHRAGAYEAWLVDEDGAVTEGTSSNAWIVTQDGKLVTRSADDNILRGVTRAAIIALAGENGLDYEERPFSIAEAEKAREAFGTSATSFVIPIVKINDSVIGNGAPGILSSRLQDLYAVHCAGADQ